MTGKELVEKLSKMSEVELNYDVNVLLCDTCYPTGDGDYDNAYYDYELIEDCYVNNKKIQIFGYK